MQSCGPVKVTDSPSKKKPWWIVPMTIRLEELLEQFSSSVTPVSRAGAAAVNGASTTRPPMADLMASR